MRTSPVSLLFFSFLFPTIAAASLLDPNDPYGFHARSMGTSRASAVFASDFSATLSNPSGLAHPGGSELTLGYVYASPALSIEGFSAEAAANNLPLLGLRLNLSPMTSAARNLAFGLAIGLEDNARGLLTLNDAPSATGQFVRQGRRQLLLGGGVGVELLPRVKLGAGILLSIGATARLQFQTSLAGETSQESMAMDVGPRFSPVLGMSFGPWAVGPVEGVSFAASYRAASWQGVQVEAEAAALLGNSPLTTLPLQMTFIDAYRPEELTLGLQLSRGRVTADVALDYARWHRLQALLEQKDTVRQGAGLAFRNVVSPRVGVEVALPRELILRTGYAYEATPLLHAPPSALNAIDNSRHVLSLGAGYTVVPGSAGLLRQPLSLDLAYQAQLLNRRSFTLLAADGSAVSASAGGQVHAVNFSMTMRF